MGGRVGGSRDSLRTSGQPVGDVGLTVAGLCKVVHPCDLIIQICRKLRQEGQSLGYTV